MANPFMPSVAGSLNMAGQDTLQQLLQRRMMEEQLAQQSQRLQAQQMQQAFSAAMRMRGDQRSEEALRLRQGADQRTAERQQRQDAEQAAEKATKERQATNQRGAADMYFEGLTRGISPDEPGMLRSMSEGKVSVSMRPKAPAPTLAEIEQKAEAQARGSARGRQSVAGAPGAGKPPKDNAALPRGVKVAIDSKKGQAGWRNATEAAQSFMKYWDSFRSAHPNLKQSAVRAYIADLYGERLTPTMVSGEASAAGSKPYLLGDNEARAAAQRRAASVPSLQR